MSSSDLHGTPPARPLAAAPRPRHAGPRVVLASLGLLTLGAHIVAAHLPAELGADFELPSASLAEAEALGALDDTLLFDLVEPEDGEGGSEAALAELRDALRARGFSVTKAGFYSEGEHLFRVQGEQSALEALRAELAEHPLIEAIEPELIYSVPTASLVAGPSPDSSDTSGPTPAKPDRPRLVPDDPMYPLQWHLDAIAVPEAWVHTRGQGATVAVIDTGVAYKDFDWGKVHAKAVPDLAGVAMVDGETFLDRALPDGLDDHAHGTHVAGTIAQATNNGVGVAGVAHEARIMPLKVLAGDGRGSVAAIANAIRYAADHGADVINMSLGGPLPSSAMNKAVAYAHSKGVTVVCAAGNEKRSRVSYPAAYKHSVAVAATDWENKRSFYSNWGKALDLSAPGGDTRADKNRDGHPDGVLQNTIQIGDPAHNDYLWFQGTSMASPHAAGVAALIVSQGVTNPDEVERILKETAHHPNEVAWDVEYGAGIIDAEQAVIAARRGAAPERGGLLLGLGLLGLGGSGRRLRELPVRKLVGAFAQLGAGSALAAGAIGLPLAYAGGALLGGFGSAGLGVGGSLGALTTLGLLSAALPLLLLVALFHLRAWRPLLVGLSLGWAAMLLHGALALPTLLEAVPGALAWDRVWLGANALLAFALARLAWRKSL